jgi:lactate 2-monooxygenase
MRSVPTAVGAHAVFIGRPFMWGLALGGDEGVEHVIRCLLADFEISMALAGRKSVNDLDRSMLYSNKSSKL